VWSLADVFHEAPGAHAGVKEPALLAELSPWGGVQRYALLERPLLLQVPFVLIRVWADEANSTPEASWEGGRNASDIKQMA
jgi:hypothetical protein